MNVSSIRACLNGRHATLWVGASIPVTIIVPMSHDLGYATIWATIRTAIAG